ncbi:unnamed protein product, partial [Polarella glacialis]
MASGRAPPRPLVRAWLLAVAALGASFFAWPFGHDRSFLVPQLFMSAMPACRQEGAVQRRARTTEADDPGFWDSGDSGDEQDNAGKGKEMVRRETPADMMRRQLWELPKDITTFTRQSKVIFNNKEGYRSERDLVVLNSKNSEACVRTARAIIKQGTMKKEKLTRMMRFGRENFARESEAHTEMNRGGLRAFRYRSGMRDLRNEDEFRKREVRVPDKNRVRKREG